MAATFGSTLLAVLLVDAHDAKDPLFRHLDIDIVRLSPEFMRDLATDQAQQDRMNATNAKLQKNEYKTVASGVEDAAYYYSTYNAPDKVAVSDHRKIMVLGGGPNRIGQGIEFDYACCHASFALEEMGIESIMVNCNPETVSTDYDTSDRLYFEPLTFEHVMEILRVEQDNGTLHGVIVQFGGQTPLKIAGALEEAGILILGTTPDAIDRAEDRDRFRQAMAKIGLRIPHSAIATDMDQARAAATEIGFPLIVRPSFTLGGTGGGTACGCRL